MCIAIASVKCIVFMCILMFLCVAIASIKVLLLICIAIASGKDFIFDV